MGNLIPCAVMELVQKYQAINKEQQDEIVKLREEVERLKGEIEDGCCTGENCECCCNQCFRCSKVCE